MFAAMHHQNLAQGSGAGGAARAGRRPVPARHRAEPAAGAAGATGLPPIATRLRCGTRLWNRAFLDPLFQGRYPALIEPYVAPLVQPGDLAQIRQKVDFLGVNYYSPMYQRADPAGLVGTNWGALPPGTKVTAMGWPIDSGRAARTAGRTARPLRQPARLHHRKRRLLRRQARPRRADRRPGANRLSARPHRGVPRAPSPTA